MKSLRTRGALLFGAFCVALVLHSAAQVASRPVLGNAGLGNAAEAKQRAERFLAQRGLVGPARGRAARMLSAARAEQRLERARQARNNAAAASGKTRAHTVSLSAPWQPVGPAQVSTSSYGLVTGRVTSLAADPADPTGNTLYVGTTGGGVWKSTNAAGSVSSATFVPLTDTAFGAANSNCSAADPICATNDYSLSIGALSVQPPGGTGVILAGTGDPNDSTDSYYGAGILRSADHGLTWSLIKQSTDGTGSNLHFTFAGNSFAGFAWGTANPQLVVAAVTSSAETPLQESIVNAGTQSSNIRGLYYSADAGATWQLATIMDGSNVVQSDQIRFQGPGNAATSVVWNPVRQMFYAAVRFHGYYESTDGVTWTRLLVAAQPGGNFSTQVCPPLQGYTGSPACPIFRGALAVQPVTGDVFALTVDVNNLDQGLWQDICGVNAGTCSQPDGFSTAITDTAIEVGGGDPTIPQADYDLYLAAVPSQQDTLLFAGTVDVFRCSLANSCAWRNTTHSESCMSAEVAPAQHASDSTFASLGLLYFGNDGGLWRSTDLVNQQAATCSSDDANHYQNLNGGLGSLAEVESLAVDVNNPQNMMVSLGGLGTAAPQGSFANWSQILDGSGNNAAIDPGNEQNWYATSDFYVGIDRCTEGAGCDEAGFGPTIVIGNAQIANDGYAELLPAPWILDPQDSSQLILGTCRVWRGPATGSGWDSTTSLLSTMLDGDQGPVCDGNAEIRSLAASGNPANDSTGTTELIYAGMAGAFDGGGGIPGHLFSQSIENDSASALPWADLSTSPVTGITSGTGGFNEGGFDISSVFVDPHDPTGQTVYVTIQGFGGNGINAAKVYASTDGGVSWADITGNLPNAPANSIVVDPNDANTVYVATDTGVWVTTSISCMNVIGSCEWSIYGTSLPNAPAIQLATVNTSVAAVLRVATYGRGVWQIPLVTAGTTYTTATATPAALTFPVEPVQTQSAPQQVLIQNTGVFDLTITSLSVTGDFSEMDTCSAPVNTTPVSPGDACVVTVNFLPTAIGPGSGVLTIFGNLPSGQITVALSGTGVAGPAIVLQPGSLSFGQMLVGQTAAAQNVTISNTGGTLAGLTSEVVTGDFQITANTCGNSLAVQSGCTVGIAFTPSVSGARAGTLTIVDSAGTQTALLSGTGLAPATDGLAPASLTFAPLVVGTSPSPPQNVTLTNNGDQALLLVATQVAGDFTAVNNCGTSLAGHASCAVSVQFVPSKIGSESGTLTVSDAIRSQTVTLNGTGLAPAGISALPSAVDFGNYAVGATSPAQTVTLTDNGGVGLSSLVYSITGDFSLGPPGSTGCGASLAAAASCSLAVTFSPSQAGVRSGSLTITAAGLPSPLVVSLSGNGEDFTLQVSGSSSMTVTSGQTATYALQILPVNGSTGSVTLACTGAPQSSTCALNPASVTLSGSGTASATVSIATGEAVVVASVAGGPGGLGKFWRGARWLAILPPLWLAAGRRRKRWLGGLLGAGLGLVLLVLPAGCGVSATAGSSTGTTGTTGTTGPVNATPAGTYTVTVTGTAPGLSHSVQLTLIVQ